MRLIDADALKEAIKESFDKANLSEYEACVCVCEIYDKEIDNAPSVEVPENAVDCVLTMFGECSYNETGCYDCEIKNQIRKALSQRPQGEWVCKEDIIHLLERWSDGYSYIEIPTDTAIKAIKEMKGGAENEI